MAWAEEQDWFGLEMDYEEQEQHAQYQLQKRKNMLNGVTHKDKLGSSIDVREISPEYARNLYYWYKRLGLIPNQEFERTTMAKTLKKVMRGG